LNLLSQHAFFICLPNMLFFDVFPTCFWSNGKRKKRAARPWYKFLVFGSLETMLSGLNSQLFLNQTMVLFERRYFSFFHGELFLSHLLSSIVSLGRSFLIIKIGDVKYVHEGLIP
jgi:hypothetical protein